MFDVVPFTRQQGFSWELVVRDDETGWGKSDLLAQDRGFTKRLLACDCPRQMQGAFSNLTLRRGGGR
ncbi:hypothetical protein, partial [Streptomyces sp. S1]|uniref:hypothetical protein n=1 Tax=Streptomyces sp. S1 TaxID=718288 RepID=UPI00196A0CE9